VYNNLPTTTIDAPEEDYLYVDPSQIKDAGKGLYTAIKIYKDEIIAVFEGEILTTQEIENRKKKNRDAYFIDLVSGGVLDSMNTECFAKYANDANGEVKSSFKNNAFITLNEKDKPCIVAGRVIKAGEEIFCSYGDNYWK
jgi:hypothetical protein